MSVDINETDVLLLIVGCNEPSELAERERIRRGSQLREVVKFPSVQVVQFTDVIAGADVNSVMLSADGAFRFRKRRRICIDKNAAVVVGKNVVQEAPRGISTRPRIVELKILANLLIWRKASSPSIFLIKWRRCQNYSPTIDEGRTSGNYPYF
jgi:hypothetical protein